MVFTRQVEMVNCVVGWFQTIQDMHLSCIIMMVFNMLFIGGFLAIYFMAARTKRKGKSLSPCLIVAKCGLALWFILTFVIGLYIITACCWRLPYPRFLPNLYCLPLTACPHEKLCTRFCESSIARFIYKSINLRVQSLQFKFVPYWRLMFAAAALVIGRL